MVVANETTLASLMVVANEYNIGITDGGGKRSSIGIFDAKQFPAVKYAEHKYKYVHCVWWLQLQC